MAQNLFQRPNLLIKYSCITAYQYSAAAHLVERQFLSASINWVKFI